MYIGYGLDQYPSFMMPPGITGIPFSHWALDPGVIRRNSASSEAVDLTMILRAPNAQVRRESSLPSKDCQRRPLP